MDLGTGGIRAFWDGSRELVGCGPEPTHLTQEFLAGLTGARFGIWQLDLVSGGLTLNDVAAGLFGLPNLPVFDPADLPVPPDERRRMRRLILRRIHEDEVIGEAFRIEHAHGEVRWLYALGRALPTADGVCRMAGGIVADTTERARADGALQERERKLAGILDNLPGAAYRCTISPEIAVTFVSLGVARLTGHDAADIMSGAVDWPGMVHSDDRDAVDARLEQAVAARSSYEAEYRVVHKSGEVRWVHDRGSIAYSESGEPEYFEGFVLDIHDRVIAEQQRREVEERYRLVSQSTNDMILDLDFGTGEAVFNDVMGTFLGSEGDAVQDRNLLTERIHPDDRARVHAQLGHLVMPHAPADYVSEHRFRRADGSYADVLSKGHVIRDREGRALRLIGSLQDVTEARRAEAALRESEAINRGIVEASPDSIKLLDLDGHILFINGAGAAAVLGRDARKVYGRHITTLWPRNSHRQLRAAIAAARAWTVGHHTGSRPNAAGEQTWWDIVISPVLDDTGTPITLVAVSRDITERREAEELLRWGATHDGLTELANRTLFQHRLAEAVDAARRSGKPIGLLLLDLDNFKQVNDSLGHDAGDTLLRTFAARLCAVCGDAQPARLGGDEFALVVSDVGDGEELARRAEGIVERLREPFVYDGRILDCHATIGAALFPVHGQTPEELLKSADIALYSAKASHRGHAVIFDPAHRAEMQKRNSMIAIARAAVRDDRIVPYYQPKVCLRDHSIYGFEALLRWTQDGRRVHLPAAITAAFEDLDLAAAISDRIIDQVIADMRGWLDRGVDFGHIAINAAAAEFRRDSFAEGLLENLRLADIPTHRIKVEVTETVFLGRGAEYVDRALKLLDESGVKIALDDFGTGYASLRHLKQFPVDVIKIDQSFVRDMETDPEDAAIIEAVLNLGRALHISVVAEGIENERQAQRLAALGCRYGQGFLFSPAVAAEQLPRLLQRHAPASMRHSA
jgi:diguanylate cyclase (GGDEF)-like protein/PAS domain S-box-containing protein